MKKELDFAITTAKEAGKIVMQYFRNDVKYSSKDKKVFNPVSEADLASERFIIKQIQEQFPNDLILSEETEQEGLDYNRRIWVIDPIDGTKSFINGEDQFSILIGLLENNKPIIGICYLPATRELYYASKGSGAFHQVGDKIERLHVSKVDRLEGALFIAGSRKHCPEEDMAGFLKKKKYEYIHIHSYGIRASAIAAKKADGHICPVTYLKKWDVCASHCILVEAGGKITDAQNNELDYTVDSHALGVVIVASNKVLHDKLLELAKEVERCDA